MYSVYRSEGYARTGYWIPGRDGKGGWRRPGDSSAVAAAVVVAHRKWVFENYRILCFLTHVRDLDALLPGNCSQFRCGSLLFSKKWNFSKTSRTTLQKISAISEKKVSSSLLNTLTDLWARAPWALGPWALALGPWALRPSAAVGPGPGPLTRFRATRFQGNAGSNNAIFI